MEIQRRFTREGDGPYTGISFDTRTSEIRNPDGKSIFRQEGVVVPSSWSQIATDILAQKYFRKRGVPRPDGTMGGETDARQVFHRLAFTWTDWGRRYGYFTTERDAQAFTDELACMLARQMGAPNSPQWFNTGLFAVYGMKGPAQGHYFVNPETGEVEKATSAYERPQPHACFILSIEDDLVNEGGIMDLITREARLFKYGSGTGTNYSKLRSQSEPLSGGGVSSGLLSFLKVSDRSASSIKSGGTTRRAARMVTLDADHPDVFRYIDWKTQEEHKVAAMVAGSRVLKKHTRRLLEACKSWTGGRHGAVRSQGEQGAGAGHPRGHPGRGSPVVGPADHPARGTERVGHRARRVHGGLGQRGVQHGERPGVEQQPAPDRRVHEGGDRRRVLGPRQPHRRERAKAREGARDLGEDLHRGLDVRGPRPPVPHDDQRLAHLPRRRGDPGVQPLLGVHVPRRHGVQPRLAQPPRLLRQGNGRDEDRRPAPRHPPVDRRPGDQRAHGAVPQPVHRAQQLRLPHPRPGLRQPRHPAHGDGHPVRQRGGPGHRRRPVRHPHRRGLRHLRRDGRRAGALCPVPRPTASRCCA